jgi:hypothetical protein
LVAILAPAQCGLTATSTNPPPSAVTTNQPPSVTAEQAKQAVIEFLVESYRKTPTPLAQNQVKVLRIEDNAEVWIVHFALNPKFPSYRRVDKKTGKVLAEAPRL